LALLSSIALLGAAPSTACTDFYGFVNSAWLRSHRVPSGDTSIDPFRIAAERNAREMLQLLETAAFDRGEPGTARRVAGDFFASCMNVVAIKHAGLGALDGELAAIDGVHDRRSLALAAARLHDIDVPALFSFGPGVGAGGGLVRATLGPESFSDEEEEFSSQARGLFLRAADTPAIAAGESKAAAEVRRALLAADASGPTALLTDRRHTIEDVISRAPTFDWRTYVRARGLDWAKAIDIESTAYLGALDGVLRRTSMTKIRSYLRYDLLASQSQFYSTAGDGSDSRSDVCLASTSSMLPRETAQLWSASHDVGELERRTAAIADAVRSTLFAMVDRTRWLSPEVRQLLHARLRATRLEFGSDAPPSALGEPELDPQAYAANALELARRHVASGVRSIGLRVQHAGLLEVDPTTVYPGYAPPFNTIVLPWAALREPLLAARPDAVRDLGSAGALLGHEFMHALDPRWTLDGELNVPLREQSSVTHYRSRLACVARTLTAYRDADGARLPSLQMADEAFADLGGLEAAFRALPRTDPASMRRFFRAFAALHAAKVDRTSVAMIRRYDEHPPDRIRVNATLANMPEFARAFDCPKGAPMVRPQLERCSAWQ
jgi:predicted metalloendopeptidase